MLGTSSPVLPRGHRLPDNSGQGCSLGGIVPSWTLPSRRLPRRCLARSHALSSVHHRLASFVPMPSRRRTSAAPTQSRTHCLALHHEHCSLHSLQIQLNVLNFIITSPSCCAACSADISLHGASISSPSIQSVLDVLQAEYPHIGSPTIHVKAVKE